MGGKQEVTAIHHPSQTDSTVLVSRMPVQTDTWDSCLQLEMDQSHSVNRAHYLTVPHTKTLFCVSQKTHSKRLHLVDSIGSSRHDILGKL